MTVPAAHLFVLAAVLATTRPGTVGQVLAMATARFRRPIRHSTRPNTSVASSTTPPRTRRMTVSPLMPGVLGHVPF